MLEGAVVRLPMQLLRQHNDAVAVEEERVRGVFGHRLGVCLAVSRQWRVLGQTTLKFIGLKWWYFFGFWKQLVCFHEILGGPIVIHLILEKDETAGDGGYSANNATP